MSLISGPNFSLFITLVEFVGGLVIAGYALVAFVIVLGERDVKRARLLVIDGALIGLGIKLAATLLKTIQLHTWEQILAFAIILALRTILKAIFGWEKERIR